MQVAFGEGNSHQAASFPASAEIQIVPGSLLLASTQDSDLKLNINQDQHHQDVQLSMQNQDSAKVDDLGATKSNSASSSFSPVPPPSNNHNYDTSTRQDILRLITSYPHDSHRQLIAAMLCAVFTGLGPLVFSFVFGNILDSFAGSGANLELNCALAIVVYEMHRVFDLLHLKYC